MGHVSLYRKYRPSSFAEVVGQDHVTTTLARAVDGGTWHHAYLFTGPRGTGKTSSARLLAMALNASAGPTSTPPADDPIVVAIREGRCPDVIEIDAASNNGVDDVRDLRDRVAFSPAQTRIKVYIVDECHMLSNAAWNAFLKTIEEPPDHVVFVFATTEPHKVLPTVLSRTQRFDLRRIPAAELAAHCRHIAELEGFTFEGDALQSIVRAGDGSARDTLSVLDQVVAFTGPAITPEGVADVLGSVPSTLLDAMAAKLADSDVTGLLTLVQQIADGGTDLRQFATDAVDHLRSLMLLSAAPEAGLVDATPDRVAELRAQAERTGLADLLRAVELLNDAQPKMRRGNTQLALEIALAKAALPASGGDPAAVAARIDRLEARIDRGIAAAPAGSREPAASSTAPAETAAPPRAPEPVAPSEPVASDTSTPEPARTAQPAPAPEPASTAAADPAPQPEPPARGTDASPASATPPADPVPSEGATETPRPTRLGSRIAASQAAAAATTEAASTDPEPTAPAADPSAASGAPADPALPDAAPALPTAAAPAGDLENVVAAWEAILSTLGSQGKRLQAIVGQGTPVAISDGALVLQFPFDFHAKQAEETATAKAITATVEQVVGTRYRIRAVVGNDPPTSTEVVVDDEESAVINHEAAEAAGDIIDDDDAHDDAIRALTNGLGAEVIDDTGVEDTHQPR